jgi:hypothetical protein
MFHPHFWWLNLSSWPIFHSPHKLSSIAGWLVMFMLCSFQIAKTQRWVSTHPGSPVSWGWNLKEIPIFHGLLNGLLVRITQQIWVYNLQQMFLKILERWYSKSPRTWIQNPDIFLPGEHHLKKNMLKKLMFKISKSTNFTQILGTFANPFGEIQSWIRPCRWVSRQ